MKPKVAIYARVSTQRQQKTQTIEQQLERLKEHTSAQGWELAKEHVFCDDGYTGTKLARPALDNLRDRAAKAEFELLLITVPDRLARNYVHQVILIEELEKHGCKVEFLDRPMSDDPHDQLLLQIRSAVAEYEHTLIVDRMRRGRQRKLKAGKMLPWTTTPYGYILDSESPRDPSKVTIDEEKSKVVRQIFDWYSDLEEKVSLYAISMRLFKAGIPSPSGKEMWPSATIHGILSSPKYIGIAFAQTKKEGAAKKRKSAMQPVGRGVSYYPTAKETWIPVSVPALITQEQFDRVQIRLEHNRQTSPRNNTTHRYLLKNLVSCGKCRRSYTGINTNKRYDYYYYACSGKFDQLQAKLKGRCPARYIRVEQLETLVWQDVCHILSHPKVIIEAMEHSQNVKYLSKQMQKRSRVIEGTIAQLARQKERLLEAYLAEIISMDEFEQKSNEVGRQLNTLEAQQRQLEVQAGKNFEIAKISTWIRKFCRNTQRGLAKLSFEKRRHLLQLLIDRVIVDDDKVEIRYVIPTSKKGTKKFFCHLRLDYRKGLTLYWFCLARL